MSSRPDFALSGEDPQQYSLGSALTYIWDVPTLSWVKNTGSGGGGGGAVTVADGADVAQGDTSDVAWVSGDGTVIGLLKTIASTGAAAGLTDAQLRATPVPVSGTVATGALTDAQLRALAVPVSGTFWQATQPVSSAALPLPAGAATSSLQTQPGVDIGDVTVNNAAGASAVNIQDGGNVLTVDGTVAVTSAGLTNLDVALSTRLKPADTLTAVTTVGTITNPVAVTSAGLTNLDVALSTRLKPADTLTAVTTVGAITSPVSTKTALTASAPTAATVGVASAQAVAANANRKGLALVNASNNRISFGIGATAVLDSGVTLYPGGSWEMSEYEFATGAINAIASAASSPLAIQEWAT